MVSYPAAAGGRFDRDYYLATHMPLVERMLRPHGLERARAWFPDDADAPSVAVALLEFRDAATRDAALASPDVGPVFADVANFTDIAPVAQRLTTA